MKLLLRDYQGLLLETVPGVTGVDYNEAGEIVTVHVGDLSYGIDVALGADLVTDDNLPVTEVPDEWVDERERLKRVIKRQRTDFDALATEARAAIQALRVRVKALEDAP